MRQESSQTGGEALLKLDSRPVRRRVCACVCVCVCVCFKYTKKKKCNKTSHTEKMNNDFETHSQTLSRPTYGQN